MTDRKDSADRPDLTPDALAPAAGAEPKTVAVRGILGESTDPDCVRVFLDVGFGTYYDILRDDVVHREALPAERSPLGVDGSLLLVRAGTSLLVHRVASRAIEHEFLAGDFTAPSSLRSYAELGAERGQAKPMRIPSKTTMTYDCCNPVSEGCMFAYGFSDGTWHTAGGGGCTAMTACNC